MLAEDIAKLMAMIPVEEQQSRTEGKDRIEGGAFDGVMDKATPFMYKGGEGINAGIGEVEWVIEKDRAKYDQMFDDLNPIDGKVTGAGKIAGYKKNKGIRMDQDYYFLIASIFRCQERDDKIQAAEQRSGKDLEALRRWQGRNVGLGRILSGHASHEH